MTKILNKFIIGLALLLVLSTASPVSATTPGEDLWASVKAAIKPLAIISWGGSQPIVMTNSQTGISYDVYLTNTGFDECYNQFNSAVYQVIEVHPRGANYGTSHAIAYSCQKGLTSSDARSVETSVGQQLVNSILPASPTPGPTVGSPTPTPTPTSKPKVVLIPPNLSRLWDMIWSDIKGLFGLSISGGQTISAATNSPYSSAISLAFASPDRDYADGTYQAKFGEWFITDSSKNIIKESGWSSELTTSPYTATVAFTPTTPGVKYYLVGVVVSQQYTYGSNGWTMVETIENKEVQEIVSKAPGVSFKPPQSTTNIISSISGWLKSIFSWLPW